MSEFFVDTSGLVKRYVPERGSAWVRSWIGASTGNIVIISGLAIVELITTLARRQREGSLSAAAVQQLHGNFLLHIDRQYLVVDLERHILLNAAQLALRHPLRSLDAIQLACAQESIPLVGGAPTFVSADRNLLAAAAAEGFPTEDPNAHP